MFSFAVQGLQKPSAMKENETLMRGKMDIPRGMGEQLGVFSTYLKDKRLRMTPQREMVVRSFLQADGHLSAEELYELVKKEDKKIGAATVFRTLKALTDCGLAREVHLSDGRTRFERLYKRPHHHHLVCMECQRTIEFLDPELEQLQEEIVSQYHFKPLRHKLEIFGVCQDCQNNRKTSQKAFDSDLVFARDALKIALDTERKGVDFYLTASRTVIHSSTKSTFLKMLEDERSHLSELEETWEELIKKDETVLDAPVFLHFDYNALRRIFPSRDEVRKKLKENLSEKEALKLAMGMELEAFNFFREYAEKFNDSKGKEIFLKFAAEEQEHYDLIKEEYDRLVEQERPSLLTARQVN